MNEFSFCGRALETPELLESEKGSKYAHLFLRVEREYKNSDDDKFIRPKFDKSLRDETFDNHSDRYNYHDDLSKDDDYKYMDKVNPADEEKHHDDLDM